MEKEKEMKGAFVERDLSWMYFNHRILQEAEKKNVPILERMSFLGIYSNNLDEFFRVRMASLNRIALSKDKNIKQDRERAKKTIKEINHLNACYNKEFEKAVDDITEELEKQGIRLLHENELNEEQQLFIRRLYLEKLNGSTNPIWLSQVKEIGATGDDGIFLAVKRMEWHEDKKKPKVDYALISMPDKEMGRFVRLPKSDGMENIMYLDDVIRYCLPMIFIGEGKATYEAYSFKFTKDAEMEMDNDLNSGVMQKVAKGVKSRKSGEPIRVIYDDSMPKELLKRIMSRLNIDTLDTIVSGGRYQNHKDLMAFPDCGRDDLKYPKWTPILKPELETEQSIIDTYLEHSRILIFANGGNPKYYLGSADWMPRNLVNRIEVLTPVYDEELQHDLERTIDYGLRDTTNARIVDGRGGNQFKEGAPFRSQEQLYVDYLKESQEMNNVINQ